MKVVAVPEGIPDRIPQELTCVTLDEGEFAPKSAAPSYGRELLQDRSFKLIKSVKLLEINNDLVFISSEGCQQEVHHQLLFIADKRARLRLYVIVHAGAIYGICTCYWGFEPGSAEGQLLGQPSMLVVIAWHFLLLMCAV